MVRALVTGSTGCLGSNLVAALNERGVDVVGLRWKDAPTIAVEDLDLELVAGDVLDIDTLHPAMEGVDWVFHVAGIADDWNHWAEQVYRTNVEGTRNVVQAAWEAGVKRFVYTSSAAALGVPAPGREILDETCEFNIPPEDWVYGHSKYLAEEILHEYVDRGLHAVLVMPTALMGRGDLSFIGGQIIIWALKGQWFALPDGGSNFIDARDAAEAHVAAAERGQPGERYLLGGHNMSHTALAKVVEQVLSVRIRSLRIPGWALPAMAEGVGLLRRLGVRLPIGRTRVRLSAKYMYYDNSKAVRELGLDTRPFAESVRDAFQWYVDHGILSRAGVSPSGPRRLQRLSSF
jgi:dihydroflavonol-4-reductase